VKLSDAGITHVRVPVPFWILEDEDLYKNHGFPVDGCILFVS